MRKAYAPVTSAFPQRGGSALCKGQTTAALMESDTQAEGARNVGRGKKRKKKKTSGIVYRMTGSPGMHYASSASVYYYYYFGDSAFIDHLKLEAATFFMNKL